MLITFGYLNFLGLLSNGLSNEPGFMIMGCLTYTLRIVSGRQLPYSTFSFPPFFHTFG